MKKSREGGSKKNTEPRAGSAPAEDSGTLREDTDAGKLITKALENCKRLFTDQYKMPFAQVLIGDHYEVMAVSQREIQAVYCKVVL